MGDRAKRWLGLGTALVALFGIAGCGDERQPSKLERDGQVVLARSFDRMSRCFKRERLETVQFAKGYKSSGYDNDEVWWTPFHTVEQFSRHDGKDFFFVLYSQAVKEKDPSDAARLKPPVGLVVHTDRLGRAKVIKCLEEEDRTFERSGELARLTDLAKEGKAKKD